MKEFRNRFHSASGIEPATDKLPSLKTFCVCQRESYDIRLWS